MYDAKYLNEHADLKAVYEFVTGNTLKRHSNQWEGACPICGGTDRFRISDAIPHRWFCRNCGESGTAIDIVLSARNLSFKDACEELANILHITEDEAQYKGEAQKPAPITPERFTTFTALPDEPSDEWQAEVMEAVNHAHDILMSDAGRHEREYLMRRGFTEETLRVNRIGFNPNKYPLTVKDKDGNPIYASSGLYIPTIVRLMDGEPYESLLRVKVRMEDWQYKNLMKAYEEGRRDAQPQKYWHIAGGVSKSLFCADYARDPETNDRIIFTEGEFDAMTINQVAGDICRAVTFGSHTNIAKTADNWHPWFSAPSQIIVCFDNENDPLKAENVRKHERDLQQEIMRAQELDEPEYRADAPIVCHLPEQYHDWNDVLQLENGAGIIRRILSDMFGL